MIILIEGVIGSGKTYFAVNEIAKRYCDYDAENMQYVLKEGVELYSNIDGLKVGKDLEMLFQDNCGLTNVFNIEFMRKFTLDKKHIFVIDECQEYFHRKFYDMNVFQLLRWSRHLGLDVILITQDIYSLSREVQNLAEFYIRVVRRSYSLGNRFKYHYMVGKEIFKKVSLPKDLKIFNLYRSHLAEETQKVKKFAGLYYVLIPLFVVGVFGGGYYFQHNLKRGMGFGKYRNKSVSSPSVDIHPSAIVRESVKIVGKDSIGNIYILRQNGKVEVRKAP